MKANIEEISLVELKNILKFMKNSKVAEPGGIPKQLVKNRPDILIEKLVAVFNIFWRGTTFKMNGK